MTPSHVLADRMPAVAHGQAEWSPAEAEHLAGCDVCQREWQVIQAAGTLGSSWVRALDPETIARVVRDRLAAEPAPTTVRPLRRYWRVGLAAAVVLLAVWAAPVGKQRSAPAAGGGSPASTVLHELDNLDSSELEAILESLPPAASATPHTEGAPLDNLDAKGLERLLRSLEG